MGWLFAVALGLQEKSVVAVLRAIVPLGLGHVVSVAIVVLAALFLSTQISYTAVHRASAVILLAFGAYRLIRARHPRWVGMRVGFWDLTLWSFLMSTAHGAGLMLLPFVTAPRAALSTAMAMPAAHGPYGVGWLMIIVHTLGYLITMMAVALVVYLKVGVGFLRTAWFNLDLVWGVALVITGIVALLT